MSDNKSFKSNRHVSYSCKYHVVFCAKYRRKVLVEGVDIRLKEIIYQVATELACEVMELGVMPDHVHILCEVDPQFGIHKFVRRVKGRSSRLLRQEFPKLKSKLPTLWTNSYFVSTVGSAPIAIMKQYIEAQKNV
jgi:REP-associated tyrosine transposase